MGKIELELSNNKLQLQQSMMMRMGMEEEQKRALWLSAARPLPPHSIRISVTADQCSVTRPPPDVTREMENAVPLPEKWWYIALEKRDKIWNFNISSMITRVSVVTTTKYKVLAIAVLITKPLTDFILYYWLQVNMDAIKIKAYWAGQARMTNLLLDARP